jgi:hypothetical protein
MNIQFLRKRQLTPAIILIVSCAIDAVLRIIGYSWGDAFYYSGAYWLYGTMYRVLLCILFMIFAYGPPVFVGFFDIVKYRALWIRLILIAPGALIGVRLVMRIVNARYFPGYGGGIGIPGIIAECAMMATGVLLVLLITFFAINPAKTVNSPLFTASFAVGLSALALSAVTQIVIFVSVNRWNFVPEILTYCLSIAASVLFLYGFVECVKNFCRLESALGPLTKMPPQYARQTAGLQCPRCGAPLEYGSAFCGNCGAQISPYRQ